MNCSDIRPPNRHRYTGLEVTPRVVEDRAPDPSQQRKDSEDDDCKGYPEHGFGC